jgi:hypothetical protein
MSLRRRCGLLWNHRALNRVRRIECALIPGQREDAREAALAMQQTGAADAALTVYLGKQVAGIHGGKKPVQDLECSVTKANLKASKQPRARAGIGRGLLLCVCFTLC